MTILYFLIASSVFLALIFLGAFFWASKSGQNEDMETPGIRMLFDDMPSPPAPLPEGDGCEIRVKTNLPPSPSGRRAGDEGKNDQDHF